MTGNRSHRRWRGLTLIELLVVVALLAALSALVIPLLGNVTDKAQDDTVKASMTEIRDAIMGKPGAPGFFQDTGALPYRMQELFYNQAPAVAWADAASYPPRTYPFPAFDRNTKRGWHGPYVTGTGSYKVDNANLFTSLYGQDGDAGMFDPWLRLIVIQWPDSGLGDPGNANSDKDIRVRSRFVRLVSAGFDGKLSTPHNVLYPDASQRGDDVLLFLRRADVPVSTSELQ